MKKIRIWLALAAAVLLCACAGDSPIVPEPSVPEPAHSPVGTVPDLGLPGDAWEGSAAGDDGAQPPREGMARSRLTNEWVDADTAGKRPIAVIIPNEAGAVPHYNLSEASLVYEASVESRISRLMAVYEDWEDLEIIGNIRSLRTYFAYWAFEWDAFIVHSGGPYFIDSLIDEPTTQHIDDHIGTDAPAFFRDSSRSVPHNLYASGQGLLQVVNLKKYSLADRGLADRDHFRFADPSAPNTLDQYGDNARTAVYIDMSGCYPLTRCYFDYDESDGLYYRSQYLSGGTDGPHIDGATGKQLSFKNILVQNIYYEELGDDGYMVFNCHDNTSDGWYFTSGKGIHINWEKGSDYGATRYYDDYGNEILLNTGKTMICVVLAGSSFTFR